MMTLGSQPRVSGSLLLGLPPSVEHLGLGLDHTHHRVASHDLHHQIQDHQAAQDDDERDQHVSQINDHVFLLKKPGGRVPQQSVTNTNPNQ